MKEFGEDPDSFYRSGKRKKGFFKKNSYRKNRRTKETVMVNRKKGG